MITANWCLDNLRDVKAWHDDGFALTCSSNEAARYLDCVGRQYVSWIDLDQLGGIDGTLKKIAQAEPDFVLGACFGIAMELIATGSSVRLNASIASRLQAMQQLAQKHAVSKWEMEHIRAVNLFANDDLVGAASVWRRILEDHPTDLMALKLSHDTHFYLGDKKMIRDGVEMVIDKWKPHMPLYGHIHGMHAFGLEENNQFAEAETAARKALDMNRHDGWATHAMAHVLEMQARYDEGLKFMSTTNKDWNICNMLSCHNYWHWGLYLIELAEHDQAVTLFEQHIEHKAASGAMLDIVDAASFLWRLKLEGVDMTGRGSVVREACLPHVDDHVLAFNDAHFLMAFLNEHDHTYDQQSTQKLMQSIKNYVKESLGTNQEMTTKYGIPICEALCAFDAGEFNQCVQLLYPIREQIYNIGGSNAQRDVFNQLLIHSCIKSTNMQHHKIAQKLLLERQQQKQNSPLTERICAWLQKLSI